MSTEKTMSRRSSVLSQSICHYNWWEPREGGMGREEKRCGLLPIHTPWQETGYQKKRHTREHKCPTTCRVPRHRCTKCTKTSIGFLAVRLSPREPKKCYGLKATSIQGLEHGRAKRRKETRDSPSFDPLAIANDGNRRNGIKEQQTPNKRRAQSSSYWIDRDCHGTVQIIRAQV
jgi:hypothetical protein